MTMGNTISDREKFITLQLDYDNMENPDYASDEYQTARERAIDDLADQIEKRIEQDIRDDGNQAIEALISYLQYKLSGEGDDDHQFFDDFKVIFEKVINHPFEYRNDPLNRQFSRAIRWTAEQQAKKEIENS